MKKMQVRPKLKLELSPVDKTAEIIGWVIVFVVWVMTLTNYQNFPDIIPTHYNISGKADGFGGKMTILYSPLISTILYIGMTMINRFPHVFNYPSSITPENALQQYTNATGLIRYLKLVIVCIFGLLSYKTIQHTNEHDQGLGLWFLPITLSLIVTPLIYFAVNSFKTKP
jgi:uncharacterized membrane protein